MEREIHSIIRELVRKYSKDDNTKATWREPVIGFADAKDPTFNELKQVIGPSHVLPQDLIPGAKSVIVFFLPFEKEIILSNSKNTGNLQSSKEWAYANIETNNLIIEINKRIHGTLKELGYASTLLPPTYNYDKKNLASDWSHRHVAYIAGVGTFGINNMLITERGCCGRIGSIVTDLPLETTPKLQEENCLFKYDGTCGKCVEKCPTNSINIIGESYFYDKKKCNDYIYKNPPKYSIGLGDVCGKCMSSVPCSFFNPSKIKALKRTN